MSERVAGIQRYYRFLDTLVAELLPASPSHIDAIILWPGRVGGRQGAMLLSGPPINPGTFGCEDCREPGPAGMILYLLGLPIADNLASRPMMDAVADDFRTRHPVRSIPNYDAARMRRSVRTGQPLDAEALERLRSLGYIR
jgi:hypothetical protein